MISEQERSKAIHVLTKSRQILLDAVEGVTDEEARWKPSADRWSILEYVEHLAISDDGLMEYQWLTASAHHAETYAGHIRELRTQFSRASRSLHCLKIF